MGFTDNELLCEITQWLAAAPKAEQTEEQNKQLTRIADALERIAAAVEPRKYGDAASPNIHGLLASLSVKP